MPNGFFCLKDIRDICFYALANVIDLVFLYLLIFFLFSLRPCVYFAYEFRFILFNK